MLQSTDYPRDGDGDGDGAGRGWGGRVLTFGAGGLLVDKLLWL